MYGFKYWKLLPALLIALVLVVGNAPVALAGGVTQLTICEENGGSWQELLGGGGGIQKTRALLRLAQMAGIAGTCAYPVGNAVSVANCGEGYTYTKTFNGLGELTSETCTLVETPEEKIETQPQYGKCGDKQDGAADGPVTLVPCGSNGGFATFAPNSCEGSCTASTNLHSDANASLPGDAIATLYVMVRGDDGQPSNDSYSACFSNPEGLRLAIYRLVSGGWITLAISNANPICASVSGDGAFYLGPAD